MLIVVAVMYLCWLLWIYTKFYINFKYLLFFKRKFLTYFPYSHIQSMYEYELYEEIVYSINIESAYKHNMSLSSIRKLTIQINLL